MSGSTGHAEPRPSVPGVAPRPGHGGPAAHARPSRAGTVGRAVLAVPVLTPVLMLLAASPAWAHGEAAAAPDPLGVTLRVVALVAGGAVAGVAVLRALSGPPSRRVVRVVAVASALAAAAVAVALLRTGGDPWSWAQVALTVALAALVARAGATAVTAGGLLLSAALALAAAGPHAATVAELAVGLAHTLAAVLWLGAALLVAAGPGRRALLRRLAPVAVVSSAVLLGTGLVQSLQAGLLPDAATLASTFGRVVALKLLLFVAVVGLGAYALLRARTAGDADRALRGRSHLAVTGLAAATACGAVLVAVAPPPAPAEPGVPLLRTVTFTERPMPVLVAPQRPGPNLVHVGVAGMQVGADPDALVTADARPGAPGGWAVLDLPAGTDRLWIGYGAWRTSVRLDLGAPAGSTGLGGLTGPDGPECATAVAGALAAAAPLPAACPADALSATDAGVLRATVRFLAGRATPALHLVGDGSPRSAAAETVVREEAARTGLPVAPRPVREGAVLVVAGWAAARDRLAADAVRPVTIAGTYTAPWLATASLLGYQTGAVAALGFDPRGRQAQGYLAALRRTGTTALASPAGFRAWGGPDTPTRLYGAVQVSFLPQGLEMGGPADRWIPGGTITPLSPPLA